MQHVIEARAIPRSLLKMRAAIEINSCPRFSGEQFILVIMMGHYSP